MGPAKITGVYRPPKIVGVQGPGADSIFFGSAVSYFSPNPFEVEQPPCHDNFLKFSLEASSCGSPCSARGVQGPYPLFLAIQISDKRDQQPLNGSVNLWDVGIWEIDSLSHFPKLIENPANSCLPSICEASFGGS